MLTMDITESHPPFVSQSLILGSVNYTPTEEKRFSQFKGHLVKCAISIDDIQLTHDVQYVCFAFKVLRCNINHCFPDRHSELHFYLSRTIFTFLSVDINFDYLQ